MFYHLPRQIVMSQRQGGPHGICVLVCPTGNHRPAVLQTMHYQFNKTRGPVLWNFPQKINVFFEPDISLPAT
jgi:hypothetical protein